MQKTDLELQEAVISAVTSAVSAWATRYDDTAFRDFIEELSSRGYKIVKDKPE